MVARAIPGTAVARVLWYVFVPSLAAAWPYETTVRSQQLYLSSRQAVNAVGFNVNKLAPPADVWCTFAALRPMTAFVMPCMDSISASELNELMAIMSDEENTSSYPPTAARIMPVALLLECSGQRNAAAEPHTSVPPH